jgi:hypothetical protein
MKSSPGIALIVLSIVMGVATFWPFNFGQMNFVRYGTGGGLVLSPHSTASTPVPPAKLARADSFTAVLRLSAWPYQGRSCVFDYATDERRFNLRVEQNDDQIDFFATALGASPFVHLKLPHAFDHGDTITAVISSDGRFCTAWHSHGIFKKTDLAQGPRLRWDSTATITFGSFVNGRIPWKGVIHSFAFFDRPLTLEEVADGTYHTPQADPVLLYRFPPDSGRVRADEGRSPHASLVFPSTYSVPGREFLASPFAPWRGRWQLYDVLFNIVGFLPFGFLLGRVLRRRHMHFAVLVLLTACVACLFSLTIETLQYFLPSRSSSLVDVVTNTIGGTIGAWISVLRGSERVLAWMGRWTPFPARSNHD